MGSEAQTRASVKFNRTRDAITIRPDKATGAKIRAAAAERGESVTDFLIQAALARMDSATGSRNR